MADIKIWHNSRCSKSRQALEVLENSSNQYEVFEYLKSEFTKEDIKSIIKMLDISDVRQMLRVKEKEYKELNISDENKTQDEIIELMVSTPKLVERPIIIKDNRAVIARPMENLTDLLNS